MHTSNAKTNSLGFIDQHHVGAVQLDDLNPSREKVNIYKKSIILLRYISLLIYIVYLQGLPRRYMSSQHGKIVQECDCAF